MNEHNATQMDNLMEVWAQLDHRVDADFGKLEAMTTALAEDRSRTLVRQTIWLPAIELIATFAGIILIGIGFQYAEGQVLIACMLSILTLFGLLAASTIWQVIVIAKIDPAAPVLSTQRQLGKVSALRIFENKWMLLLSPALWAPFLVVIVEMFAKLVVGFEGTIFSAKFVVINLLIGLALAAGLYWLSQSIKKRYPASPFLRQLLDDFSGRRLTAARKFLARLEGYEEK